MSEIYKSLSDARKLVSIGDTDYDIKTDTHILKDITISKSNTTPRILRLYTDGSSLKSQVHKNEQTFSGWGYFIIGFKNGSQKSLRKKNGWIFDGTPLLSELEAIRQGLEYVNSASYVSVVTDSTDSIKELKDLGSIDERLQKAKKDRPKSREDQLQLRILNTLKRIQVALKSPNVAGMEIVWQPSHTMDKADVCIDDLRTEMEEEIDFEKKMFLMDVYGNEMADKQAGKGSRKAVEMFVEELRRQERKLKDLGMMELASDFLRPDVKVKMGKVVKEYGKPAYDDLLKYSKGLSQSSKLFYGSRKAKGIAIEFLGERPSNYISDLAKNMLFSESDQQRLSELIENNFSDSNPDEICDQTLQSFGQRMADCNSSEADCLPSNNSRNKEPGSDRVPEQLSRGRHASSLKID